MEVILQEQNQPASQTADGSNQRFEAQRLMPTFVLKTGLMPTFIRATMKNRSEKVGLWPKKVGFCPLLRGKSGQKNGPKNPENRPKLPKIDRFSGFLGHFLEEKRSFCPFAHFCFLFL
ncbi:MAG: hypothetical protein IJ523_07320 [Succinivibrionaceae bacterium]|nr:hypothetical protein [Succinivibrionaceae bacterium]